MSGSLSPDDRERLEELFDRAADLPAAGHADFLDRECAGQDRLRAELQRLLQGLVGEDLVGARQPGAPLAPGTRIGPYVVGERIGGGGMGEVYVADQREPVARRVALKVIKPGMDSAQVVARFDAERQALARMAHPHVAQVFDGGVTPEGRPYFVMELVDGLPLTDHCDQHRLSTRERLELLLEVCEGVQHAHLKGIIHRDLKPSNLLVTRLGGRAIPKIIDFGVARATTGSLAERTLHTMVGQVVGTLDYMSPEQADPTGLDVDTRSDVYSLGVVLYQLVSGLLPFDHATTLDQPLSEVQRTIREVDPPTPSTRLKRETATGTAVAPLRSTDPRSLIHELRGDLDWICMKALEKDPARRYQSVAELADDLRRHLADQPVLAGRPGPWYRARKFARRHKVGVTAGALVVVALGVGVAGILAGKWQAEARATELLRLSVRGDLEVLEREAESLYPPYPDRIPALQEWMTGAEELVRRLPVLRTTLADLRSRSEQGSAPEEDRQPLADAGTRAKERSLLEALLQNLHDAYEGRTEEDRRTLGADEEIARVEAAIADLGNPVARTFGSKEDQWQHDELSALIADLEGFEADLLGAKTISDEYGWSMPLRLAKARDLEEGFAPGGRYWQMWEDHLPAIQECYEGWDADLVVTMQMGLVPLWHDEQTDLWEFAHLLSGGELARRGEDDRIENLAEMGMVLVLIPGGTFTMGAQADPEHQEPGANYDPYVASGRPHEGPPHRRDMDAFFLSKFEMTQSQWLRCRRTNPSVGMSEADKKLHPDLVRDLLPVNQVTWTRGDQVTRQLGLSLPQESQWEYAARAYSEFTVWWTGNEEDSLEEAANIWDSGSTRKDEGWLENPYVLSGFDDGFVGKSPVGWFSRANAFGLHDIHGNVAEWCANSPYSYGEDWPPRMETRYDLPLSLRIARGASNRRPGRYARLAARGGGVKELNLPDIGLRPAREIAP